MADKPRNLLEAVRTLLARLVAIAQTRLELLTNELSLEIQRGVEILLWSFIALFFGGLTVLMLALTLVIALWDTHRVLAAGGVAALFALVTLAAAFSVRARLQARTRLLGASLEELKRDAEALGAHEDLRTREARGQDAP